MGTVNDGAQCSTCHETAQWMDPLFSGGICIYCGYWNIPPGPEREADRAERAAHKRDLSADPK